MISSDDIFNIKTDEQFTTIALQIFKYQAVQNKVYKKYLALSNIEVEKINSLEKIPFLPVEFFKTHKIITGNSAYKKIFYSSGTTGSEKGKHFITDTGLYQQSSRNSFSCFYDDVKEYCFLALLPSYLENKNSSLVYMMNDFISNSCYKESGFYLFDHIKLVENLKKLKNKNIPTILLGVSFALLDLAEKYTLDFNELIIMETGGMKGRREEVTRNELHEKLKKSFCVKSIHSEYGMTELLSQSYSKGDGKFYSPPWMKILIRDSYDPRSYVSNGKTGGINIIDLANINSISFIETQDLGKINNDSSFEVLGRNDHSEIRGCNLLISKN